MYFKLAVALCVLTTFTNTTRASPVKKATDAVPIMGGVDFPDPAIIRVPAGWHLFSTNAIINNTLIHIQRAFTPDWKSFHFYSSVDALPRLPQWAANGDNPRVWAPDVSKAADGSFVMYYAVANKPPYENLHCLSYATAKSVADPFVDSTHASFICPISQGGAIDPAGFTDETNSGRRWLVYKIDGNAIGHGGSCGNTVDPVVPTPIMLQQLGPDGTTLIGGPIQILTNIPADGPYIEAPSLTYMKGRYVLFFSTQCYQTAGYDVQYAVADAITGPYTRMGTVFKTGIFRMTAPGGLDLAINGDHAILHANYGSGRAAFTGQLSLSSANVISAVMN